MDVNKRIVEILSELLIEFQETKNEIQHLRKDTNERFAKLEKQQIITNKRLDKVALSLGEVRHSVMKLGGKIEQIADLDKRLKRVEKIVSK